MAASPLVLVADDHQDSRLILRDILVLRGGRVLEAEDGETCLRVAREQHPDVIVLDLFMPRMDGWQVAEALRSDADTAAIPILVFTASAMPDDHRRALEAGCRRVLVKPAEPGRVADEVAALHAEHLALVEASAALRQQYLAARAQLAESMMDSADLRARSAEQRTRAAEASAAASALLGGNDPPAQGPAGEVPPAEEVD